MTVYVNGVEQPTTTIYSGSATVAAKSSLVDVTHGYGSAPNIKQIKVTPQTDLSGRQYWVSDVGASTFRINISTFDFENAHVFSWEIIKT